MPNLFLWKLVLWLLKLICSGMCFPHYHSSERQRGPIWSGEAGTAPLFFFFFFLAFKVELITHSSKSGRERDSRNVKSTASEPFLTRRLTLPSYFALVFEQIMEYANDLKQFWKRGYGHDINKKSSCVLFHDLFNRLERAAEDHKYVQ